jgi:hypothetical protein
MPDHIQFKLLPRDFVSVLAGSIGLTSYIPVKAFSLGLSFFAPFSPSLGRLGISAIAA